MGLIYPQHENYVKHTHQRTLSDGNSNNVQDSYNERTGTHWQVK